jgi:hypothetical protein
MTRDPIVYVATAIILAAGLGSARGAEPPRPEKGPVARQEVNAIKRDISKGDRLVRAAAIDKLLRMTADPASRGQLSQDKNLILLLKKLAEQSVDALAGLEKVRPEGKLPTTEGELEKWREELYAKVAAQARRIHVLGNPLFLLGLLGTDEYRVIRARMLKNENPQVRQVAKLIDEDVARRRRRWAGEHGPDGPPDKAEFSLVVRSLNRGELMGVVRQLLRVRDPGVRRGAINELHRVTSRLGPARRVEAYGMVALHYESERDEDTQLVALQRTADLSLRFDDLQRFFKYAMSLPTTGERVKKRAAQILSAANKVLSWEPPPLPKKIADKEMSHVEAALLNQFVRADSANDPNYESRIRIFDTVAAMIRQGETIGPRLQFLRAAWETQPALKMAAVPAERRPQAITATVSAWRVACLLDPVAGVRWVYHAIRADQAALRKAAEEMLHEVFPSDVRVTIILSSSGLTPDETFKALLDVSDSTVKVQVAFEAARLAQQGGIAGSNVLSLFENACQHTYLRHEKDPWEFRLAMVQAAVSLRVERDRLLKFLSLVHSCETNTVVRRYIKNVQRRFAADGAKTHSLPKEGQE